MAAATAPASSRSTPRQVTPGEAAGGGCPPGRCQATTPGGAPPSGVSRRSNRWPAAKPAPPVTRTRRPGLEPAMPGLEVATPASERPAPGVLRLVVGLEGGVLLL